MVGQRERVEHLDLLDRVAVAEIDPDIARERRCLTTDVHDTRDTGRGEQIDDLAPGPARGGSSTATSAVEALSRCAASARRTESVTICTWLRSASAVRAARVDAREVSTLSTRPEAPTASPSAAAKTPAPP